MIKQQLLGHVRPADGGDVIEQVGGDLRRVYAGRRDRLLQRGHQRRIGIGPGRPQQMVRDQAGPVTGRREHLRGSPVSGATLRLSQLGIGHLAEQIVAEPNRAGRIPADQARRYGPLDQLVQHISRTEQHGGQVADANIRPPHRQGGEHVTRWLVQLPELRLDHLVQAGTSHVKLELGLDGVRSGFRQGARILIGAQQFACEQRVAGGQPQDAAQQRARPPARPVEHQAFDHHPAHRGEP